eukprot:SAG31_NODE_30962_length_374_cov_0.734545_1_plen_28_part_10
MHPVEVEAICAKREVHPELLPPRVERKK